MINCIKKRGLNDSNDIGALIKLLDDPDVHIYNTVASSLVDRGMEVIPELENAWEYSVNQTFQERIENIIQTIQFNRTRDNIKNWMASGAQDILEGAFYIARFQYPDLEFNDINAPLEKIKREVWLELNNNLTALEKVRIFNHIIFEINKFTKNSTNYYSPHNSFINQVLETRKGNAISLAIIYIVVAQKLEIPIYGVNLPRNFILVYKDVYQTKEYATDYDKMLFYINPFNGGAVLGRREIDHFLEQLKISPESKHYLPCTNADIMKRILQNLVYSYELLGYADKIEKIMLLMDIIKEHEGN